MEALEDEGGAVERVEELEGSAELAEERLLAADALGSELLAADTELNDELDTLAMDAAEAEVARVSA